LQAEIILSNAETALGALTVEKLAEKSRVTRNRAIDARRKKRRK
jgi:hypothetical protein